MFSVHLAEGAHIVHVLIYDDPVWSQLAIVQIWHSRVLFAEASANFVNLCLRRRSWSLPTSGADVPFLPIEFDKVVHFGIPVFMWKVTELINRKDIQVSWPRPAHFALPFTPILVTFVLAGNRSWAKTSKFVI